MWCKDDKEVEDAPKVAEAEEACKADAEDARKDNEEVEDAREAADAEDTHKDDEEVDVPKAAEAEEACEEGEAEAARKEADVEGVRKTKVKKSRKRRMGLKQMKKVQHAELQELVKHQRRLKQNVRRKWRQQQVRSGNLVTRMWRKVQSRRAVGERASHAHVGMNSASMRERTGLISSGPLRSPSFIILDYHYRYPHRLPVCLEEQMRRARHTDIRVTRWGLVGRGLCALSLCSESGSRPDVAHLFAIALLPEIMSSAACHCYTGDNIVYADVLAASADDNLLRGARQSIEAWPADPRTTPAFRARRSGIESSHFKHHCPGLQAPPPFRLGTRPSSHTAPMSHLQRNYAIPLFDQGISSLSGGGYTSPYAASPGGR
ncbi:hypothetical protein B0H14DRAFT_2643588 [Mycena olivaceomarginata]|nr:hypothetical protein B0H14DRAFT_2643588 [Mycena olivaceomarginata]